ncbi:hypothetical protein [Neptunitalea lumnitzerae]|uniref:Uncharacterized protein n=1 Tax=Neptunitalea lumnitzerae TaxID=2965509 RepID=A0ABQ5ME91_9FLAO|nr:hypothetical protein [Neptunitalea sp. Y10]GLB47699.1 hypothetical protein Y10_00670 [Neptunitalea sp. Y10]
MTTSIDRLELYNLIWSTPVTHILTDLNISNTNFKKICKDFHIPLPPNGYWQKIKFGKRVEKIALPENKLESEKIELKKYTTSLHKKSIDQLAIELQTKTTFNINRKKLIKPDPIVSAAKNDLLNSKASSRNGVENLYCTSQGIVNIYVSKALINRALIFTDTLIKVFRQRGHDIKVLTDERYTSDNGTKAIVYGEKYNICIKENRNRVIKKAERYWNEYDYAPNGILSLRLDGYPNYQWQDTPNKTLEDKIPNIIAYLESRAKGDIENRERNRIRYEEQEKERKEAKDHQEKINNELELFKNVLNNSSRWQKSVNLRNYINAVRQNAIERNTYDNKLINWLEWISNKADWYDPFIEKEDELFKDIDRDSI